MKNLELEDFIEKLVNVLKMENDEHQPKKPKIG